MRNQSDASRAHLVDVVWFLLEYTLLTEEMIEIRTRARATNELLR
jgi:hypothetical protein